MTTMFSRYIAAAVSFACYSCSYASNFAEADVGGRGIFSLSHSSGETRAMASISVRPPQVKDPARPIGNFNSLTKLNIVLNGIQLAIPKNCKDKLLDVNYIKLENVGPSFRFWVQGGDGSESYQVAFNFALKQPVKCQFLPDANGVSIVPMLSQKTYDSLTKSIKK